MILRGSRLALPRPNLAAASLVRPPVLPAARRRQSTSASTLDPAISVAGDVPTQATSWPPGSRRTGVLARKKGMATLWDDQGLQIPVTVLEASLVARSQPALWLIACLTAARHPSRRAQETALRQPLCGPGRLREPTHRLPPPTLGTAMVHVQLCPAEAPRRRVHGRRREGARPHRCALSSAVLARMLTEPIRQGTLITAAHFVPGQYVDVKGISCVLLFLAAVWRPCSRLRATERARALRG